MQEHRYRRIYISDELERLHSEFIWQLCDADAHRVVDLGNHFVFVNLHRGPRVGVTVISPTLGRPGGPAKIIASANGHTDLPGPGAGHAGLRRTRHVIPFRTPA